MAATTPLCILDQDRKTGDLVSAFLTYKGYAATILESGDGFFDTPLPSGALILLADLKSLKLASPEPFRRLWQGDPRLVLIVYSDPAGLKGVPQDERALSLSKPLNLDELESLVQRAVEYQKSQGHIPLQPQELYPHFFCSSIIGKSRQMMELFETIQKVAESNSTVLLHGESGTGKELAARAIHQLSGRSNRSFVPVNCAAIPVDLLESELFGHVKGSFTGAYSNRKGRFELADKGTLFLDEIGDMQGVLQSKLLRVLQSREFEPVGSTRSQKVDVRIVAASNKNLEELVANGSFREDLFYRLSVIPIVIPPLRERREDIPLLISHFQASYSQDRHRHVKGFSKDALDLLCDYDWPGNVRELENLVERMITMKDSGFITVDDLPEKYLTSSSAVKPPVVRQHFSPVQVQLSEAGVCLNSLVEAFENSLILQALELTGGNKKEAAALLNLKRTTLIEKIKKRNLQG